MPFCMLLCSSKTSRRRMRAVYMRYFSASTLGGRSTRCPGPADWSGYPGPSRGSAVAKVRVYELAKEFGVESKAVMARLQEMGELVRSASSTIEAPVVRRLKEELAAQQPKQAPAGKAVNQKPAGPPAAADTVIPST